MDDQHGGNEANRGVDRRSLMKGTAVAVGGALAASALPGGVAYAAPGDVPGSDVDLVAGTGGGAVPLRPTGGLLHSLDRNQYLHNMEIISHISGVSMSGGEPLTTMWTKGKQRLLRAGSGFLDVTEPKKPFVFNTGVVSGQANVVYNEKLRKWILLVGSQAPLTSPTPEFPRGKYHPEYAAKSTSSTAFRGIRLYDGTDPSNIQQLSEFGTGDSGSGTHMNFYDGGRYAYLDCGFDDTLRLESTERPYSNGLMIVDVSDPSRVKEVSRWWVPGQRIGEEKEYNKYVFAGDQSSWTGNHGACIVPTRIEDGGHVGFGGFGAFGMYVHDFRDIRHPKVYGKLMNPLEGLGGIPWHTIYPLLNTGHHAKLRNLAIGVFEGLEADGREPWHTSYVIDIGDIRQPRIVGIFPRPAAPPGAPFDDFVQARGRFSSHNIQSWVAPGRMRPEIVALSYFNAGVRLYDVSDPTAPREVGYFVPPRDGELTAADYEKWRRGTTEQVFIEWDRNLIWVGTHAGTYCLSSPALGKPVLEPRKVSEWTVPHVNRNIP